MTYFLSFVMIYINLFFAFGKKHSKLISILLVSLMWILFWGSFQNPDYNGYLRAYNIISYGNIFDVNNTVPEIGFRFLMKVISYFDLDYHVFLKVISLIGFLLINSTIRKYTRNPNYVYILYFIFPFLFDVIQIRNFLAIAIIIFSIRYLFTEKRRDKIKYVIAILLATTIHNTSFIYLPLIFINNSNKNKFVKITTTFSVLGSIIMLLVNNFMPKVGDIIYIFLGTDKYQVYFLSKTRYGYLLFFGMQIMSFIMMKIAREYWIKNKQNRNFIQDENGYKSIENQNNAFIEFVYWVSIFAFAFFPFYILSSNFTRLMRNLQILYYIAFSITSDSFNKGNEKVLYNILVVTYVVALFLINIYIPGKDSILDAIFKNNLLFK